MATRQPSVQSPWRKVAESCPWRQIKISGGKTFFQRRFAARTTVWKKCRSVSAPSARTSGRRSNIGDSFCSWGRALAGVGKSGKRHVLSLITNEVENIFLVVISSSVIVQQWILKTNILLRIESVSNNLIDNFCWIRPKQNHRDH